MKDISILRLIRALLEKKRVSVAGVVNPSSWSKSHRSVASALDTEDQSFQTLRNKVDQDIDSMENKEFPSRNGFTEPSRAGFVTLEGKSFLCCRK